MKRGLVFFSLVAVITLAACSAMAADNIKGRIGVTGRIGFIVPSDSEAVTPGGAVIGTAHTDVGFIGGGGFLYGITDNIAGEIDITHASFGSDRGVDFDTTNISLGAQYRFLDVPVRHLVPYAGGGLAILINGADNGLDVDTTAGVYLTAGADYFVTRELAVTSELKGVIAPDADIKFAGTKVGNFDPTSFSMTFGVRYFFN